MILYIFLVIFLFLVAYFIYGSFIEKIFKINFNEEVPSQKFYDGIDFVPTNKFVLLGHHFSSIAGAGPIVGPIMAGLAFGWLPAIVWIVIGTIFIGGVHDFFSLVISVKHQGKSIAEVANRYLNKTTYKLFLIFIWLALMYVVAVFTDIAATSFSLEPKVAQISILYVFVAIILGLLVYKINLNLSLSTILTLVLIIAGILFNLQNQFLVLSKQFWVWIIIFYSFLASILPVWFLLQPRDYLSSYFLYFSVFVGLIGLVFGKNQISYPLFISFNSKLIGPLVPFMFITIACGAISGFHSLVSSGTTSKQLDNIKNARFVSYGGMLLEGVVAAISLSTLMILSKDIKLTPQQIYALGIGKFCSLIGIKEELGRVLGYLAISAFILTTLDTATRISRYIFQELIEIKSSGISSRISSTIVCLILPIVLLNLKLRDLSGKVVACWQVVWPIFGITNQLLAALVLLVIYVWVKKQSYKDTAVIFLPMVFMLAMTTSSLSYNCILRFKNMQFDIITISSGLLLILTIFILLSSIEILKKSHQSVDGKF